MQEVKITKDDAVKLYASGNEKTQQWVIEKFGKELFDKDYVRIWDDFLKEFKLDISLPYPKETTSRQEQRTNASHMLDHIVPAERNNVEPDYSDNNNQRKYEPLFRIGSSGFGFSYSVCDRWSASTTCGSRLCTFSDSECERVAKKYLPIYERKLNK